MHRYSGVDGRPALLDCSVVMRVPPRVSESGLCERLRRLMQGPVWRRRLVIACLIVGAQAVVLCVTYRAVVVHGRTLLTGQLVQGPEGAAPPYGYLGPDGVGIYLNRDAAPRAQVYFDVTSAASEENAAALMLRPGFDPAKTAIVETGKSLRVSTSLPIPSRIDSYTDSRVVMTTTTSAPGTLVLADAYYPGWEAYVDEKPATIYSADIALRGVLVPAGTHTITMEYRPQSVVIGALGVPAGVLLFGLGAFAVPRATRAIRRSASSRARRQ
jgi:hypothetical protein